MNAIVRLGIIGIGNMGLQHARQVLNGKVQRCELRAACDTDPNRLKLLAQHEHVRPYADLRQLLQAGDVDAVLIATPHYDHTVSGIAALKQGLHVLVEKPVSVHTEDCQRLIAAHQGDGQVFAAMFNQRTDPHYRVVKELIDAGELGELTRINWIITDWFRTEAYYASGGWRATWQGEGGGVLVNQCPHQLDLLQWLCGMPALVQGFCALGKRHRIEVEDEVTAYFEFPGGATGVLVTSTGEAPGTNRLEICGQRGRVVVENGRIRLTRNQTPAAEFSRACENGFAKPDVQDEEVPVAGNGGQHVEIVQNFVEAILDRVPLIAPAEEGLRSVELANAILYSSVTGRPVRLPLDGARFARLLRKLVRESIFPKPRRPRARPIRKTANPGRAAAPPRGRTARRRPGPQGV